MTTPASVGTAVFLEACVSGTGLGRLEPVEQLGPRGHGNNKHWNPGHGHWK